MTTRRNFFKSAAAGLTALVAAPFVMKALPKPLPYGVEGPVGPPNPTWCNRRRQFHSPYDHAATRAEAKARLAKYIADRTDEMAFQTMSGMK